MKNHCQIPSKRHRLPIPPVPPSTEADTGLGQDKAQPRGPKTSPMKWG